MTLLVWISNRIHYMKKVDSHTLIHTIMAESKISVVTLLAIHGVVVKRWNKVNVVIGEKKKIRYLQLQIFCHISDLSRWRNSPATVIEGGSGYLVGSAPLCGEEKDAVAAKISEIVKKRHIVWKKKIHVCRAGDCSGRKST